VSWLVALLKTDEALARSEDSDPVPTADPAEEMRLAPADMREETWALAPRARTTGVRIVEARIVGGLEGTGKRMLIVSQVSDDY
jgi:hypothetical protein